MLWVPKKGILRRETNMGTVGTTTLGTSVTTGASATTKGTAAELIAATAFDAYWVVITITNVGTSAAASAASVDILLGAATEEIIIADLLAGNAGGDFATNVTGPKVWAFPLYIPAGTRIAAQAASVRTATAIRVGIELYGGDGYPPFRVGGKVTTYGMGTVPNGTSITPGASGAAGTYTQITAGTSEDHFAFVPSFQPATDTTMNNRHFAVAIGIGAATETEIGVWHYITNAAEQMSGPSNYMPAFADVPSGTRLAMRASNSGVNDAAYNGVIHAVS